MGRLAYTLESVRSLSIGAFFTPETIRLAEPTPA